MFENIVHMVIKDITYKTIPDEYFLFTNDTVKNQHPDITVNQLINIKISQCEMQILKS